MSRFIEPDVTYVDFSQYVSMPQNKVSKLSMFPGGKLKFVGKV